MASEPDCKEASPEYVYRVIRQCFQSSFRVQVPADADHTFTVQFQAPKDPKLDTVRYLIVTKDNVTWHSIRVLVLSDVVIVGLTELTEKRWFAGLARSIPASAPVNTVLVTVLQQVLRDVLCT